MVNPEMEKDVRDACTAFELQVPVSQRRAMEELFTKVFKDSTANDLNFILTCFTRQSKRSASMKSPTVL
jgi:hypothetical protein